jgi:hypothetical protein
MAKTHHVIVADRDGDGADAVTSEIVAAAEPQPLLPSMSGTAHPSGQ